MKKLWLVLVVMVSFGITACSNETDFETYISDIMYMYDGVDSSLLEITEAKRLESDALLDEMLLEDLLIFYSDLSVKLGVAREELDLIGKYGSDKFLYNAAYKYIDSVQSLYQDELHKFVMLYAKYKQDPGLKDQVLQNLVDLSLEIQNYDVMFTDDLNSFITKYEKIN